MGHQPLSTEDLRQSVARMEQRLEGCSSNRTNELMVHYWALVARFEVDLADEHERLMSRNGALMLIQAADPNHDHHPRRHRDDDDEDD